MIDLKKLFKSFTYAFYGIKFALKSDQNLIIHIIAAVIVIFAGMILEVSINEMAILGLTILVVITAEMINTALEKMVDLITKEHRMEAKIAKDVSSAMVLISAIGAIIIGLLIFIPHLTS